MLQPRTSRRRPPRAAGCVVHDKAAPPGFVMVNVTELVLPSTVFPPGSCTLTTGWVGNATPPVEPLGCVVNASFAAAPTVIVERVLVADVKTRRSRSTCTYRQGRSCNRRTSQHRPPRPSGSHRARQASRRPASGSTASPSWCRSSPCCHRASCTFTTGCVANATPPVEPTRLGRERNLRRRADRDRRRSARRRRQTHRRPP